MDCFLIFYNKRELYSNNKKPVKFDYRLYYQPLPAGSIVVLIANAITGEVLWENKTYHKIKEAKSYIDVFVKELSPWYNA